MTGLMLTPDYSKVAKHSSKLHKFIDCAMEVCLGSRLEPSPPGGRGVNYVSVYYPSPQGIQQQKFKRGRSD